jgi:putative aldouronate transport system permease protein
MEKVNISTQAKPIARKSKLARFTFEFKKNFPLFLMLLPGSLAVITFNYLPLAGLVMAFKKINYIDGPFFSPWVGLDNFKFMFEDAMYLITRNTLLYNLTFIVLGLICSVSFAIALNELKSKIGKKVYQTIIMLPHFLSMVIVSYLVLAFLNPEYGLVNTAILKVDEPIFWYNEIKIWPYLLVFVHLWKSVGYSSIVYFAAIAGIDQEMYEAAVIDGASKWQQIRHITIPSLYPLMIILTILNVGKIFNADFGLFFQVPMGSGPLFPVTQVIDTYVYRMLRSAGSNSLGMAAAAGFYQSVCGFILVLTTNAIVKKIDPEKSLF